MEPPPSDIDLFSDDTLTNTPARYRTLRDIGPVVYLQRNDLFALTHFDAVRAALRADDVLINGRGVAANDFLNTTNSEATLISDGAVHSRRRAILIRPLLPKSLAEVRQRIKDSAGRLVRDLLGRDGFCGVRDFAAHLPVSIVAELVGLEESGRENMLEWAAATFNALGPMNDRTSAALERTLGLVRYVQKLSPDRVRQGSWAGQLLEAAERGELTLGEAATMVVDYVAPSLDTTILASAHMLWRLGVTDGAFEALRRNPSLAASAVNESVRLASPIREFTRYAQTDFTWNGVTVPARARAAVLYASANWDERHYESADAFRVDRNPRDHVGWGHGVHICAGMHLARLEMESLARALIEHVEHIEVGEPVPIFNSVLQGFESLPAAFH